MMKKTRTWKVHVKSAHRIVSVKWENGKKLYIKLIDFTCSLKYVCLVHFSSSIKADVKLLDPKAFGSFLENRRLPYIWKYMVFLISYRPCR